MRRLIPFFFTLFLSLPVLAQSYIQGHNFIQIPTVIATAAGTTTLTVSSDDWINLTGSTTQTVKLASATGLQLGRTIYFLNDSTGTVTVQYNDASTALTVPGSSRAIFKLTANGTTNGTWSIAAMSSSLPLSVAFGGTGLSSGTSGGIPYFSSTSAMSSSALLAANQLVIGGGAGSAPTTLAAGSQFQVLVMGASVPGYGQVNLGQSAAITGTLPTGNGGTGQTSLNSTVETTLYETIATTLGDILYGGSSGAPTRLAGNITSTKKFLAQTGNGSVSAAPAWSVLVGSDLPNPSASTLGGVQSIAAVSHNFLTSISTSGVPAQAQPVCADLSNAAASCSTDATNASNISSGTLGSARGGAGSITGALKGNGSGVVSQAACADLSNAAASCSTDATNASNISSGTLALNRGGTGQTTKAAAFDALQPMTTGGDLIYGGASGTGTRLANGSAGQYLRSAGTTAAPTWQAPAFSEITGTASSSQVTTSTFVAPTVQKFLTGSGVYTTPTSPRAPLYLKVKIVGGGGGGGGSGTASSSSNGTIGNNSTFSVHSGAAILTAAGGGGGLWAGASPAGGAPTVAAGATQIIAVTGNQGGSGVYESSSNASLAGGMGAAGPWGGAGGTTYGGSSGSPGASNAGAGGGGAGTNGVSGVFTGAGGGAGAYIEAFVFTPSASYDYVVAGSAAGGNAGASGNAGAAGSNGVVIIEEYYQ